jgi:hypothetical protein
VISKLNCAVLPSETVITGQEVLPWRKSDQPLPGVNESVLQLHSAHTTLANGVSDMRVKGTFE